jgi:hypothetical protein
LLWSLCILRAAKAPHYLNKVTGAEIFSLLTKGGKLPIKLVVHDVFKKVIRETSYAIINPNVRRRRKHHAYTYSTLKWLVVPG